jgi:hypothetical protein
MKKILICLFLVSLPTAIAIVYISTSSTNIIKDDVCVPPCWRNITPGKETLDNSLGYIYSFNDVNIDSIQQSSVNNHYWDNGITWEFSNRNTGEIYFKDSTSVFLHFNISDYLPLFKVVKALGEPDQIRFTKAVVDGVMVNLNLVYLEKGVCLELSPLYPISTQKDSINVTPFSRVKAIEYFDNTLNESQINSSCFWPLDESKIQFWQGYTSYDLLNQ